MKHLLLSIALLAGSSLAIAQETANLNLATAVPEQRGLSLELGAAGLSYQDIRFSKLQYFGGGGTMSLGLRRSTDSLQRWGGFKFTGGSSSAVTGLATVSRIGFELGYGYERFIASAYDGNILVGGDLRATFEAITSGASGNNSNNLFSNVSLSPRASYVRTVKNGRLIGSIAVGLLNFYEDGTSFTFSQPQDHIEAGEFTYQPSEAPPITPFIFNDFAILGQYNEIRTLVRYERGRRWGFQYDWMFRGYRVVKGYPTRAATHRLTASFTL
ncbi:MAG: hypothetical protein AB8F78_15885 [Saprospiraceae bacterium]